MNAIDPSVLLRDALAHDILGDNADRPLFVVSAGKAAWPMARTLAAALPDAIRRGVGTGPRPDGVSPPVNFTWYAGGHPDPTPASVEAGRAALALAATSNPDGALLVLLSGGASAMLAVPAAGITLEDKVRTSRLLMDGGAPIDALNSVRKHLSAIKGGRLGAAAGASLTLAISDVHFPRPDDPAVIGSGPTAGDPTTFADALAAVRSVSGIPRTVTALLERGARGELPETVKPGDPRLDAASLAVIGGRMHALEGARRTAEALDYHPVLIPEPTHGEAREAASRFLSSAREAAASSARPVCVLAAGETTVRVRGSGTGGRNQEFVLAAVQSLGALGRAAVLASAGTDGIDGPTPAAGAVADSATLERAERAGLDWRAALQANDAYPFFSALHDLIVWGPTGTNTGDLQVLLLA